MTLKVYKQWTYRLLSFFQQNEFTDNQGLSATQMVF